MLKKLRAFLRNDRGQDLIEYTMLLAFLCLVVTGIFVNVSGGVNAIWTSGNTTLTAGAQAASGTVASSSSDPAAPPTTPPADGGQQPGGGDGHHDDHHDYR